ncbi:MAG: heparan-alpha-glucosaminide N-acetyltransferase [Candidatus Nanoarchaeia archaeon]|nr:heparan-alpha-glucosaminide N-acetyltransferase [Candidatus Nanoarchaeia archaeon]
MKRVWLIDFLRGTAVIMMIVFHFLFYADYFGFAKFSLYSGLIGRFQMLIPLIFIFVSGVSSRIQAKRRGKKEVIKRGFKVLGFGMTITLATLVLFPESFVFFGILHLIGACIILSALFNEYSALVFGAIILFISNMVNNSVADIKCLSILGFNYPLLNTFDYYPLIPWMGVFLAGMFGSKFFLKLKGSRVDNGLIRAFCWAGKNSLKIYFAHIIVLYLGFYFAAKLLL